MRLFTSVHSVLVAGLALGQSISSVSPSLAERSGRLKIEGSGFGALKGAAYVNGVQAPVARWSDTQIIAYVPEATPIGSAQVHVSRSDGQSSNSTNIHVLSRPGSDGRVRWKFLTASLRVQVPPVQGLDGSVYIYGLDGNVYALTDTGAIKWITDTRSYGNGDISVHPDGRIICGGDGVLVCLNPSGEILWRVILSPSDSVFAGPTVGPDGKIYAGYDEHRGATIFDMDGNELWNDPSARSNGGVGGIGYPKTQKVAFGGGNWTIINDAGRNYPTDTWSYRLGGGSAWHLWLGLAAARTAANGNAVATAVIDKNTLACVSPSGQLVWTVPFSTLGKATFTPAVTASGQVFTTNQDGQIFAVGETGQIRWTDRVIPYNFAPCETAVRPDGARVLAHAGGGLGQNGVVVLYTNSGERVWTLSLPILDGQFPLTLTSAIAFSRDQQFAMAGSSHYEYNPDPQSYVYAFETDLGPPVNLDPTSVSLVQGVLRGDNSLSSLTASDDIRYRFGPSAGSTNSVVEIGLGTSLTTASRIDFHIESRTNVKVGTQTVQVWNGASWVNLQSSSVSIRDRNTTITITDEAGSLLQNGMIRIRLAYYSKTQRNVPVTENQIDQVKATIYQ